MIIGDFTKPPFEKRIPLTYHATTKQFVSRYLIEKAIRPGVYKLKFIVNGEPLCDGCLPISQDMYGNFYNIITISTVEG
jgi:hypothetical protein